MAIFQPRNAMKFNLVVDIIFVNPCAKCGKPALKMQCFMGKNRIFKRGYDLAILDLQWIKWLDFSPSVIKLNLVINIIILNPCAKLCKPALKTQCFMCKYVNYSWAEKGQNLAILSPTVMKFNLLVYIIMLNLLFYPPSGKHGGGAVLQCSSIPLHMSQMLQYNILSFGNQIFSSF